MSDTTVPPADSLALAQAVDALCDRFEAALRRGETTDLTGWLPAAEPLRGLALPELVRVELEHRWRAGETVRVADYLARYPELVADLTRLARLHAAEQRLGPPTAGPVSLPVASLTDGTSTAVDVGGPAEQKLSGPAAVAIPGYEVLEELGRGGMGLVLRVRDRDLERTLAVKLLLPRAQGYPGAQKRFLEEARLTGQLQHPGIPPVHELGRLANGLPFFAMKLIRGRTLADLLKERAAATRNREAEIDSRFLVVFRQVCQTIAYAHSRGIIHRDLKPSNIMVGAFGEVQVMDWGLAKVLSRLAEEEPTVAAEGSTVYSSRLGPDGLLSLTGDVMGTPGYMAPEQARGEVRTLDERTDVFGLGAILCELLTGRPPFWGGAKYELLRQTADGDLTEASQRLDGCGAGSELIELAKRCLAPRTEDRPRHAGQVAEAVERYEALVQERLRTAELDREKAQVQAEEERKRREVEQARAEEEQRRRQAEQARADEERKRREVEQAKAREERKRRQVQLALMAMLLLLVLGGSGAGVWYWQDQARQAQEQALNQAEQIRRDAELANRKAYLHDQVTGTLVTVARLRQALHEKLSDPLKAHVLLSDIDQWANEVKTLAAAWQLADSFARSGPELLPDDVTRRLQQLGQQVKADERDFEMANQLDAVRLQAALAVDGKFNPRAAGRKYPQIFARAGYDVVHGDLGEVAARLRSSTLCYPLVAALDHWADVAEDAGLWKRLLALARQVDPDPWRDQFRDPKVWNDREALARLAAEVDTAVQSPPFLVALGRRLHQSRGQAAPLLRKALLHHPRDFWLHYHLGEIAPQPAERVARYQAALAVRPRSSAAHINLGGILKADKDYSGALTCFRRAVDCDPNFALAHNNLGQALEDMKDPEGAMQKYKKALELDPKLAQAHYNLGQALRERKDLEGAIRHFQKAVQIDPNFFQAHNNLGDALLKDKRDLAGAMAAFQKALELAPDNALVHYNLGTALTARGDRASAIRHYRKAVALDPTNAQAHNNLGGALFGVSDVDGALPCFRKALELDPNYAQAHNNLAGALYTKGDRDGALRHYHRVLALNPNYVVAWYNLGQLLGEQDRLTEALQAFQRVRELGSKQPGWKHPEVQWLNHCEQTLQALDRRLAAILQGQVQPRDVREQLALADRCWHLKKYPAAQRFYAAVFTAQPALAGDLKKGLRFRVACCAVLAAEQGQDGGKLAENDKALFRQQALDWLRADLNAWRELVKTDPAAASRFQEYLEQVRQNPDLAGVRDPKQLARLPAAEQTVWQQLWAEVESLGK